MIIIRSAREIDHLREAGRIVAKTHEYLKQLYLPFFILLLEKGVTIKT